jgi:RNA polymerase sigma factor (sigma-70 family)
LKGVVWNVCRQTLRHTDDAEDAFQATFLALACKASALHVGDSLGPWLYRVASRVAARARADRRRRADRERSGGPVPESEPYRGNPAEFEEISRALHDELCHLPERLRAPIVLCYLEGMTHDQAARELRCPVGTVRSRLARSRDRLRGRILRRGLVTTPAAFDNVLAASGPALAVPPHFPGSMVKVAAQLACEAAPMTGGCAIPARVATLLEGVLNVLRAKQLVGSMAALAAIGTVTVVAALSVFSASGQTGGGFDPRPLGPDGRRIGPPPPEDTFVKTYYVGDLLMLESRPPDNTKQSIEARKDLARCKVDMSPVIDMITAAAARGTWTVNNENGQELTSSHASDKRGPVGRRRTTVGQITPFYLSISLIIRQTKEGHEEVADLLRKLRRLVYSMNNPDGAQGFDREMAKLGVPAPDNAAKSAPAKPVASSDRKARISRLLDELRQEVENLPKDGE